MTGPSAHRRDRGGKLTGVEFNYDRILHSAVRGTKLTLSDHGKIHVGFHATNARTELPLNRANI